MALCLLQLDLDGRADTVLPIHIEELFSAISKSCPNVEVIDMTFYLFVSTRPCTVCHMLVS